MALETVLTNDSLVTFLSEVSRQQQVILSWYRYACERQDTIRLKDILDGTLTEEDETAYDNAQHMKVFCTRIIIMLNDLIYFASKELD